MLPTNTSTCVLHELGHLMAHQAVEAPNAVITSVAAVASAVITSAPAVASTAAPWAPWAGLAVGIVKKALGNKEKEKLRTEVSNLRTENEGLRTEYEGLRTEYENLRKRKGDADATILEQGIKIAKLEEKQHGVEDSPSTPAHEVELEDETQKAGPASASHSPAGSSPKNAVVLD